MSNLPGDEWKSLPGKARPNLPARLLPTLLSTRAANLMHSLVYDAQRMGEARGLTELSENHSLLCGSRKALAEYISELEQARHIPQEKFFRFD